MIDFVKISKVIDSDDLMMDSLNCISSGRGWMRFILEFKGSIDVTMNFATSTLTIKGSLPYFLQGHNFSGTNNGTKQAIKFTVSCDSKDELPNEDNQEENGGNKEDDDKEDKFYLRVGSQTVSLRNTDISFYIDITSNTEWSIKIDQGIVGGNPAMGGGDIPAETWLTAPSGWSGVGNDSFWSKRIMF